MWKAFDEMRRARLDRRASARGWSRCRPTAARRSCARSRRARDAAEPWQDAARPSRAGCACRRRSATSSAARAARSGRHRDRGERRGDRRARCVWRASGGCSCAPRAAPRWPRPRASGDGWIKAASGGRVQHRQRAEVLRVPAGPRAGQTLTGSNTGLTPRRGVLGGAVLIAVGVPFLLQAVGTPKRARVSLFGARTRVRHRVVSGLAPVRVTSCQRQRSSRSAWV